MARKYRPSHIPDFDSFVDTAKRRAYDTLLQGVREFAEEELDAFKDEIRRQNFPSFIEKPLTEKYKRRKERKGADPRVMIATHHYLESMRIFERDDGDGKRTLYIGFDENDVAHDLDNQPTDFPLVKLAEVHEYGAPRDAAAPEKRIPARPHWSPHLRTMREDAREKRTQIRRNIIEAIKRHAVGEL